MANNPYESPNSLPQNSSTRVTAPTFPFVSAGPIVGAAVGLSHVAAMAGVWAFHGYPDFFIRSPDWVFVGAVLMAGGGALFGILYAGVLALTSRLMSVAIRPRPHFYAAVVASIILTIATCELSLRCGIMVNPLLVLAAIVGCTFVAALVTSQRVETSS